MIGLEGVRALCAAPAPFRLNQLCLNGAINCDADDETPESVEAVRVLANSPKVARLRYPGLHYNGLGEAAVAALVASPHLPRPPDLEFDKANGVPERLQNMLRQEFGSG